MMSSSPNSGADATFRWSPLSRGWPRKLVVAWIWVAVVSTAVSGTSPSVVVSAEGWTVTHLERTLDLSSSHLSKVRCAVHFQRSESPSASSTSSDSEVIWLGETGWSGHVAFIGATTAAASSSSGGEGKKTYLRVQEIPGGWTQGGGFPAWKIQLKSAVKAGQTVKLEVDMIVSSQMELFPQEITQREKQLVLVNGNHYMPCVYPVKTQTTKVLLPNKNIESYSKQLKPASVSDNTLTYGPYTDVQPLAHSEMSVHFENNNPFLVVTRLERTIELSMWGNIAIEETVDLRHAGAKLKGSFSRYEFQRENSGASAVKSFKTMLPAAASDVYYRDDIGNISTSALRTLVDSVELDLRPRFPLFGGWKTHYFIGYNVPSYEYLYHQGERYILNMRVIDHVYDDMLVEDFALRIILPEGSKVTGMDTPFKMARQPDGLHFTYLDVQGRPLITLTNRGPLTEKHIQDFQLQFNLPKSSMVQEPLLLILAFFIFFALTIVYVRLDFAITKDENSEIRMKVAGLCDKILNHQDKRFKHYEQMDEALAKYKTNKEQAQYQTAAKKLANDAKTENQAIVDLLPALKAISGDTAEKVAEIQRQDKAIREHQNNQVLLFEKFLTGKLPKAQFVEQDTALVKKRDEARERIDQIYNQLRASA